MCWNAGEFEKELLKIKIEIWMFGGSVLFCNRWGKLCSYAFSTVECIGVFYE